MTRRCVRDHRLTGANLEMRPDGRLRCLDCHREWARLSRRVARLREVLARHHCRCSTCQRGGTCATLRMLLARLDARERAFDAWRALGRRTATPASHATVAS